MSVPTRAKKKVAMKSASEAKNGLRCGEVAKSYLKHKKIMQKVCVNGKVSIIHAGAAGMKNNHNPQAKRSFRARHQCSSAKYGTPRHLACEHLWPVGNHGKWDHK